MEPNSRTSPSQPLRICLFGASLDTANMGCSALTASLIGLLCNATPDVQIRLLYGNQSGGKRQVRLSSDTMAEIEVVNCRMSPRSRLREHRLWILGAALACKLIPLPSFRAHLAASTPWLRHLLEADLVGDISGGDSFSDIYGVQRLLLAASEHLIAALLGKRVLLLPQTCGPFRAGISRCVARWILRQAPLILVRDPRSAEVAKELLGTEPGDSRVILCPDVAFSLASIPPKQVEIDPPIESSHPPCLIGVNVSGLLYMGGYTHDNMFGLQCDYPTFCIELIKRLASRPNTRVLLIPHTFPSDPHLENDQESCRKIWESVRQTDVANKVHLLKGTYDQSEIKAVIGQCNFFLGARMHACIAAISQGIPCVGLAYSRKFLGVFETAGVQNMVLDMRSLSLDELINACLQLFESRQETAEILSQAIPQVKQKLYATFRDQVLAGCLSPGRSQ